MANICRGKPFQIYSPAYLRLDERRGETTFPNYNVETNIKNPQLLKPLNGVPACMLFLNKPISARLLQHLDADWFRVQNTKSGRGILLIKRLKVSMS